jgi:hypothetical protein
VKEGFLPVAAPSSVIPDRKNEYYRSDDECLEAIAAAMRAEYRAIVDAGLYLQLDDARLAVTYDRMVPPSSCSSTAAGSPGTSRSSTPRSRASPRRASGTTFAGAAGPARTPPTCRSPPSST